MKGLQSLDYRIGEGRAQIRLAFDSRLTEQEVEEEISSRLSIIRTTIPAYMSFPRIIRDARNEQPDFRMFITGDLPFEDISVNATSKWIPELRLIGGISLVDISGLLHKKRLLFPKHPEWKSMVKNVPYAESFRKESNGTNNFVIRAGKQEYPLRYKNRIIDKTSLKRVRFGADKRYWFDDLIFLKNNDYSTHSTHYFNGKRAVAINIYSHDNSRLTDIYKDLLQWIRKTEEFEGVKVSIAENNLQVLNNNIAGMLISLGLSIVGIIFMFYLFMRDIHLPVIIGSILPLSVILTLGTFQTFGISINIISLSGLILGTGLLIDNSIVIVESIVQNHRRGIPVKKACIVGLRDVIVPLSGSNLTTIGALSPLIFADEIIMEVFREEAKSLIIVLAISIVLSCLLIPLLYSKIYRKRQPRSDSLFYKKIKSGIEKALLYSRNAPGKTALVFMMLVVAGAISIIRIPAFPEPQFLKRSWTVLFTENGNTQHLKNSFIAGNSIEYSSGDTEFLKGEKNEYASLRITGLDAAEVCNYLGKSFGFAVYPSPSVFSPLFDSDRPDIEAKIYAAPEILNSLFVSKLHETKTSRIIPSGIAQRLRLTQLKWEKNRSAYLDYDRDNYLHFFDPSVSERGHVPVFGNNISHEVVDRSQNNIQGDLMGSYMKRAYTLEEFERRGLHEINEAESHGANIRLGGKVIEGTEISREFFMIGVMSLIIIYILLVVQFGSLKWPLFVLSIIPVSVAGSVVSLYLTGQTINSMSGVGIVAMLGIVVNDAILKVNALQRNIHRMELNACIRKSIDLRLKPILMTTATTIICCVPMLVLPGTGNEIQKSLAIALIGGIFCSTFASLFLIPGLLSFYYALRSSDPATNR